MLFVIVLPAPTVAPLLIVTGATNEELEPINTPSPIFVLNLFKSLFATGISASGSSVKLTLIVSPNPSSKSAPIPTADLILPSSPSPASVTPKCNG